MEKIRLLIACEDAALRQGLNAIFGVEDVFCVLGSFSLKETFEKSISFQPDVILFDLPADEVSKKELNISQIKHGCPCSLIIALVENTQSSILNYLLELGIDGCIPKGIMRGSMVKAIELACRAGIFCIPFSFKKIVSFVKSEQMVNINQLKSISNNVEMLTKREMEILQLMAENYSNREIASKLFISEPTVKTHVSSILRKLDQNNRAQAIIYSYKIGLVKDPMVARESS